MPTTSHQTLHGQLRWALDGVMTATLHKVVAGNGYQYYLRKVAANDDPSRGRSSLADYYSVHGESPGRWHGAGLASLGLQVGDEVTESQMESLFGLGLHPNAEQIHAQVFDAEIDKGAKPKDAERAADQACRLGNPFRIYSDVTEYRKRCAQAFERHNIARGADPDDDIPDAERSRIRTAVATKMFVTQYRRAPLDDRELSAWVARNSRPKKTAVAGFDITFSPVKSVSVLWALAPRTVAERIEAAHHAAVDTAMGWLERNAIYTRLGRNGIRQVDVQGLVAAWFVHRESRAGDPDLHTHVFIANRVCTLDGHWRTLDATTIYQTLVTASEIYNTCLELSLQDMVGVEFAERAGLDPAKRPIREIVGIPAALNELWSQRDAAITRRLGQLTRDFQRRYGREPLSSEMFDLMDRATLDTRPGKPLLRSLAEQRTDWRGQAVALLGGREAVARTVATALNPVRRPRAQVDAAWIARTAKLVIGTVSAERSVWQHHHIRSETERQLRGHVHLEDWKRIGDAVVTEALSPASVLARGDPDIADQPRLRTVPMMFARRDGSVVYTTAGSQAFTTPQVLSIGEELIDLALEPGGRTIPPATLTDAIRAYNDAHPDAQLNAGQLALLEGFASSPLRISTVDAPAGTGKTTAMQVITDAWQTSGGTVLGLAPTAAAAKVLGTSIGARVETVDKLLDVLARHTPTMENVARQGDQLPSLPQWVLQIDSDTLVVIDEHVKIGDRKRLALLRFLTARDATIRCLGDPKQLPAIEAGGGAADMTDATEGHTLTLSHVVRFATPGEGAASLGVREGDPAALGFYLDHGRIHSGSDATTHHDAYTGWASDYRSGRDTIMLAANHKVVGELNQRARADRLARSGAPAGPECVLADELRASVGDTIATRHNAPRLRLPEGDWVRNGYRWIVSTVHDDGSLTVTHLRSGRELGHTVILPPQYVRRWVRLGYAATIDSAQGVTADTCHVAFTGYESLAQFYVAMTRGAHANHAYVPTTLDGSEASFYSEPAVFPRTATEVLLRVLGRDTQKTSAHTALRDALDPDRRIGRALDIYLDALGLAAENALGDDGLARIDAAAERIYAGLTDCLAYPILRQHLAVIALIGEDPITALDDAAAARELDTADDVAAVLDWRLDPTGAHSHGAGPLPWAPGLPHGLDPDTTSGHLTARRRIVADLAGQIRAHTATWTPATAPWWARPLIGTNPHLVADLAVWRASLHIDDRDLRPTGPTRYIHRERAQQQLLDARVTNTAGDLNLPAHTWEPVIKQINDRIPTDPWWTVLADRLDTAARAGLDITTLLTHAAAQRPLPDDMPAAALWFRLDLDPAALSAAANTHTLRPDWTPHLRTLLGADTADHVLHDSAWPRIVAAIDRAAGTAWTPQELLSTAHELLLAAHPDTSLGPRPDQLATALAWRITALLNPDIDQYQPEPPIPDTETPSPTMDTDPTPFGHHPNPDAYQSPTPPDDYASHQPSDNPAAPPEMIGEVAALFRDGHLDDAVRTFRRLTRQLSDDELDILERIATTLYTHSYPVAKARLRWAADRYPQHHDLIHACTPVTDPRTQQTEPHYRRDERRLAARDNPARTDPTQRRQPLPPARINAERATQDYLDTRADIDDDPDHLPLPDGVSHPYYHKPASTTPDAYATDYDRAAIPNSRGFACLTCGIERSVTDTIPRPDRHSDDGLCGTCRDDGTTGIPDHDPADHIPARCAHIASIYPAEQAQAKLRGDWRRAPTRRDRHAIADWVRNHPFTDAPPGAADSATFDPSDPIQILSDRELTGYINHIHQRLALQANENTLFGPAPTPARAGIDEPRAHQGWLHNELADLQAEQHRRTELAPEQAAAEDTMRAQHRHPTDPSSDMDADSPVSSATESGRDIEW